MGSLLLGIRTWWETADRTQRVVTIFGSVFLVALILGTVFFASRPKMDLLFGGVTPSDQAMVMDELQKLGIVADIDRQGNVYVPTDKVAFARAKLAQGNKLPVASQMGYGDLQSMGMMTTPSVERERLKAILEAELARSVQAFDGVKAARIHITLGNDSPIEVEKKPSMASVGITESDRSPLSQDQGSAIARLVASAVPGLDVSNVTVMTTRGSMLWDGHSDGGVEGRANHKLQAEIMESARQTRALQQALDTAFGSGNTVASVAVELDFDKKEVAEVAEEVGKKPYNDELTSETYGKGVGSTRSSGTNTNTTAPAQPNDGTAGDKGYESRVESKQFPLKRVTTNTEKAAGTIVSKTISVLADDAKIKDTSKLEEFLQGQLGSRANVTGFTYAVTQVPFDRTNELTAKNEATAAASGQKMQQMMSLLPLAALLIVGFMVVKALGKNAKSQNVLVAALPGGSSLPVAYTSGGAQQTAYHEGERHAMSSGSHTHGHHQAALEGSDSTGPSIQFNSNGTPVSIDAIEEKVHVPLEQIKKMASDRPDSVAMLLKSWILETTGK